MKHRLSPYKDNSISSFLVNFTCPCIKCYCTRKKPWTVSGWLGFLYTCYIYSWWYLKPSTNRPNILNSASCCVYLFICHLSTSWNDLDILKEILIKNLKVVLFIFIAVEPPFILTPPTVGQKGAEGQTVELTCEVYGSPRPFVVWSKSNEQLTGGRFSVLDSGNLQITVCWYFNSI